MTADLDQGPEDPGGFALTLPPAEAAHLREVYARARVILEYGSGGSTFVAAEVPGRLVMSVESDAAWSERIRTALAAARPEAQVHVHHVDIGPTQRWGIPVDRRAAHRFHLYAASVWDAPFFRQPDVVLVDGRFRVACLLTAMVRSRAPVTVLFDDYANRAHYHWVEALARPVALHGRMAHFEIEPRPLPPEHFTHFVGAFADAR